MIVLPFEDYNDLVKQLLYFRDNKEELFKKRINILEFAKDNLIWEKYDNKYYRSI